MVAMVGCNKQGVTPSAKAETPSAPKPAKTQSMWVSHTTGKTYQVTQSGDVLRAEWTDVPPDWVAHGGFLRSELKRQGDKWVGTSSSYLPWTSQKGPKAKTENWCHLETKFEIDSITADTISGQGETVKKIDTKNCRILDSGSATFLWKPQ